MIKIVKFAMIENSQTHLILGLHSHMSEEAHVILPSPLEQLQKLPPSMPNLEFIEASRFQIKQILDGHDPRMLLIVGPCSVHDITAIREYAIKLKHLQQTLSDTFFIVMRVHFEKPRTGFGWKGFMHDPWLDGSEDIHAGIHLTRQLLLELTSLEIPIATEFMTPVCSYFFKDLISWGCIGARTSASSIHRQLASNLPMPIAFKNSLDGNIEIAAYGAAVAAQPQNVIGINGSGVSALVKAKGNLYSHIVLRGGTTQSNYDPESIQNALGFLEKTGQPARIIVDCSHGNSKRIFKKQIDVFQSVIQQFVEGNSRIRGVILESHLFDGCQDLCSDISKLSYGVSITDPCLGWNLTEQLLMWGQSQLSGIFQENLAAH